MNAKLQAIATALPVLPGKTNEWKKVVHEATGPRRAELDEMHRRLGLTGAYWFLQQTPNGDVALVVLEGEGAPTAIPEWSKSTQPFEVWFRDAIGATYGIDFTAPPPGPAPEMFYEFHNK